MKQRLFTVQDQSVFARLSGDSNPVHVDALAARRTLFGQMVVHGIHAALWGLDTWAATLTRPVCLQSIRCEFTRPIPVDALVECTTAALDDRHAVIEILNGGAPAARLDIRWDTGTRQGEAAPRNGRPEVAAPRSLTAEEVKTDAGNLDLHLDIQEAALIFPRLLVRLPHSQIALLLATSRLVGMVCPGLYSLYSELDLRASNEPVCATLHYQVKQADKRFRRIVMDIDGAGMAGKLIAFTPPPPPRQATYTDLRSLVKNAEFAGQRALIVGGSRGLGEVTAKLLAAGGAGVRITYLQGREDAAGVVKEIVSNGGTADCVRLNVLEPVPCPADPATDVWLPTHFYFFATPFISAANKGVFSPDLFRRFCDFYVSGFLNTVEPLIRRGLHNIFYPSTTFLDELPANMGEYAAAKAAGETVCTFLERTRTGISVFKPRLPRMATDQTASLLPADNRDPAPILLEALRRFRDLSGPKQP